MQEVTRTQVLAFRVQAQQLDRAEGTLADTDILDIGVQDSGPDGSGWALANRGVSVSADDLVTAWTLRGAPHVYRRADVNGVAAATAPFSDADAGKRIFDGSKPLKAAGISNLEALDAVAAAMRSIVEEPMIKGEMSTRLTALMPAPYLRPCVPCNATHMYEQTFRLAALRAGLELMPGTSPPVLRPIPDFSPARQVPQRLDVIRGYLRFLGPATPQHVAWYLDAPVKDVTAHWPDDAVEVSIDGSRRWMLDPQALDDTPVNGVRLLGPFDGYLQNRDRDLLLPDRTRQKEVWRTIGRPGAVLNGAEISGTWRARQAGSNAVTVTVTLFRAVDRGRLAEQAERLAAFRGRRLAALDLA